jgi:hypothetical protein
MLTINTRYLQGIAVPRLSLWKNGTHSNDYKFFDQRISEIFTISGTGVLVHKYLGPINQTDSTDLTQPSYATQSELNIQDLLLLENRDRKYEENVYRMRGIYQVTDNAFDLTQFGLFLQTGTLFMTFHINDMIATMGRKIMNGDVLELEHLMDYETLDPSLPVALKRFFVVSDCTRAAEGYSPTWWPHLWRCKINPLVDSQEYKDILSRITASPTNSTPLSDILSSYNKYVDINNAVVAQSEAEIPVSGYDTSSIYHRSQDSNTPDFAVNGYLTGMGVPPNGLPTTSGITFPNNPTEGQYHLRTDYLPNRLFRFDGTRWTKIEDEVRTNITNNSTDNLTQRNSFITNDRTFTDVRGNTQPEKQNLNDILKPRADN